MTRFARRAERVQPSAIREFLALAGDPRITSFAGGYPDPTLFPMEELHKIYDELLTADNASALQYTASDGLPDLRALVAARLFVEALAHAALAMRRARASRTTSQASKPIGPAIRVANRNGNWARREKPL